MIASCALAYVIPFELVLLSYAFLGPAHYLTQISWMHDRNYFVKERFIWLPAVLISGLVCVISLYLVQSDIFIYGLYALALSGAAGYVFGQNKIQIAALTSLVFAAFLGFQGIFPDFVLGLVILLPTLIHIYIFTGAFILLGAIKSKSKMGALSFIVFCACAAIFFLITPQETMITPNYVANNIGFFEIVADYLADILSFGGWVDSHAMLGFLSFAYTYHYLNWFSKVEIIKWHEISRPRLCVIAALYTLSIGLYLYDYRIGFFALLFLSLLHVILEFPLNIITFKTIGAAGKDFIKSRLKPPQSRGT